MRPEHYVRSYEEKPEGFWHVAWPRVLGWGFFALMAFVIGAAT